MAVFVAFKSTYNKHFLSSFAMQITMLISHHTYKTTNYANTQQIKYYVHTHNSKKPSIFLLKGISLLITNQPKKVFVR